MELSGQLHAPAALSTGKELLVPTGQENGWFSEPVWTKKKKEDKRKVGRKKWKN
jgi:hypothetical protein